MENDDADTVIGLDVRGQVFYCNKSKLLNINNGSSYFSARFREDSMLDAGLDRVDNEGRDIYKLDRDPTVFNYIMDYIDTNKKPIGIGAYEMNKKLWRLVGEEALYFGLDSLVQLLRITFTCSPNVDEGLGASGKGIMHWLGTKKGASEYVNPYSSGAIDISLWSDEGKIEEIDMKSKELMVQYRPSPEGVRSVGCSESGTFEGIFSSAFGAMMGCNASDSDCVGHSIGIHLLNGVAVSPTHYSITNSGCYGMAGDWNLEASVDGRTWNVIHESRGESPLYGGILDGERKQLWDRVESCEEVERIDAVCDYMEENHRNTWRVVNTSGNFYTHFRFMSIEINQEGDWTSREYRETCLHGINFEVFGDVYEDWKDESKTRIEQLEIENEALPGTQNEMQQSQIKDLTDQNMKLKAHNETLLNENDSLKARIRQLESKRSATEACLPER